MVELKPKRKLIVEGLDDMPSVLNQTNSYQLETSTVWQGDDSMTTNLPIRPKKRPAETPMVIMTVPPKKKKNYGVMSYLASSFKSIMGKKSSQKPMEISDQDQTVNESVCDMSITQPGASPPMREFRQFEKF